MPDDAPSFLSAARAVVLPISAPPRPDRQAFRTLFSTLDHSDAISAGFEAAEHELGELGGYAIHFDGRGSQPTVHLELMDGKIVGFHAIREARKALEAAEKMAARMTGRTA